MLCELKRMNYVFKGRVLIDINTPCIGQRRNWKDIFRSYSILIDRTPNARTDRLYFVRLKCILKLPGLVNISLFENNDGKTDHKE